MRTATIKASKGSEQNGNVVVDVEDGELVIRWFCGATYRFDSKQAHEQWTRLLMVMEYGDVWVGDRSSQGQPYFALVEKGKFTGSESRHGNDGTISWAQFKKAIETALKEIPAPNPEGTTVSE